MQTLPPNHIAVITETVRGMRPDTQVLYVFGSYADGSAGLRSDIDLALYTSKPLSSLEVHELRQELAAQLNQDVDLIDLREASHLLCNEVVQKGKRLFQSPEFDADQYELQVISQYLDFQEGTKDLREAIRKRGFIYG